MKTKTWLIVLGVLAIIFGGLGLWTNTRSTIPSGWRMARNLKMSFEVAYPPEWKVIDENSPTSIGFDVSGSKACIGLGCTSPGIVMSISTINMSEPYYAEAQKNQVKIGKYVFTQISRPKVNMTQYYYKLNDTTYFSAMVSNQEPYISTLPKMLSTLSICEAGICWKEQVPENYY